MDDTKYISIERLSGKLGLSREYLNTLVAQKKIPFLKVGSRLKFNPSAVQAALDNIAQPKQSIKLIFLSKGLYNGTTHIYRDA